MANARNVSTSFLPYGGITYFINSFDYQFIVQGISIDFLEPGTSTGRILLKSFFCAVSPHPSSTRLLP